MLLQLIQEPKFPFSRVDEGIAHSQQSQPLSQPSALNRETIRPLTPQQGKRDRDENVAPEDHSDIRYEI